MVEKETEIDISETFIKMCENAEEIQATADDYYDRFSISCWHSPNHVQCKGHFTDWHMAYKYCPVCSKKLKITPEYSICSRMEGDDNIWLPRQDQLQEMLGEPSSIILLEYIFCFVFDPNKNYWQTEYTKQFTSMEQLWLAFVMKDRYNKVWNKEDWK